MSCHLKCDAQSLAVSYCASEHGHWHCVVCHGSFSNNMQAYGHESEPGNHECAWYCHEHNTLEVVNDADVERVTTALRRSA